jgi:hypothetical protein
MSRLRTTLAWLVPALVLTLACNASGAPAGPPEGAKSSQGGPRFTVDDCSCGGISIPLEPDGAYASKDGAAYTTANGTRFENVHRLKCEWTEEYESELVSAMKILDLEIFAVAERGKALYTEFRQEASAHLPYCEEDTMCTPELIDSSSERYFYVEKTVFERSDGVTFPSTHYAYLASSKTTPSGVTYVVDIGVILPELEPGSTQATDAALALERCALSAIGR